MVSGLHLYCALQFASHSPIHTHQWQWSYHAKDFPNYWELFEVLLKDTLTCRQEEPVIEPPTAACDSTKRTDSTSCPSPALIHCQHLPGNDKVTDVPRSHFIGMRQSRH